MDWTDTFCTCFLFLYLSSWVQSSRWKIREELEKIFNHCFLRWMKRVLTYEQVMNDWLFQVMRTISVCCTNNNCEQNYPYTQHQGPLPSSSSDCAPPCGLRNPHGQMHVVNTECTPPDPQTLDTRKLKFPPRLSCAHLQSLCGSALWGGLQGTCVYLQAKGKPAVVGEVLDRVWLQGLEYLHSYA